MILRSGTCVKLRADQPSWVVVVLLERHKEWWTCKVIQAPVGSQYHPVGGYDISVHADDLRAGQEIVSFEAQVALDVPSRVGNYVEYVRGKPRRVMEITSLEQDFPTSSKWVPIP